MQPIPILVAVLLGLVALTYVLYPLYAQQPRTEERQALPVQRERSEKEQNARQALSEVEFDFQLGNLEETDYQALRSHYMHRALLEMKQRHQRELEIDEEIEVQLQKLKDTADPEVENEQALTRLLQNAFL